MVISGSEGRIEKAQNIAQLLASRGFNSLAIAYFSLDGLPKNLEKIPIEAIEEGIEYLESSLFVDIDNIGIYGRSKGAELALLATSKLNGIKCLVLNSPSYIALEGIRRWKNSHSSSWSFRGKELPYQKFRLIDFFKRICSKNTRLKNINPQSVINIKHCDISLLMIASKTDEVWQAEFSTHKIQEACSKKTTCKVNLYEETGHMLTIGYQPNNRYSKKNSSALLEESVHSWEESINFFKKHLKSEFADKQKNQ